MVFDNLGGRIASHLARHWSRYLMYGATTAVGVAAAALLHRVPPTRGRKVVGHLGFIAVAVAICMLAPHDYQDVIFSPAGAAVARLKLLAACALARLERGEVVRDPTAAAAREREALDQCERLV